MPLYQLIRIRTLSGFGFGSLRHLEDSGSQENQKKDRSRGYEIIFE
jgi:hypothetical protein